MKLNSKSGKSETYLQECLNCEILNIVHTHSSLLLKKNVGRCGCFGFVLSSQSSLLKDLFYVVCL